MFLCIPITYRLKLILNNELQDDENFKCKEFSIYSQINLKFKLKLYSLQRLIIVFS